MDQFKRSEGSAIEPFTKLKIESSSVIAFLSVKPQYAEKLISGSKKYEFRKTAINRELSKIIIYSTSPVKKIIGVAEVELILQSSPTAIWEKTKHASGITRKLFREYYKGKKTAYALKIDRVIPLKRLISPNEIENGFKVPQSFRYVDKSFYDKTLEKIE